MLTFEQIKELIELVASHRLSGFELERSGFRLKIDGERPAATEGNGAALAVAPVVATAAPPVSAAAAAPPTAPTGTGASPAAGKATAPAAAAAEDADDGTNGLPPNTHVMTSPIVGTFYEAPNPGAAPFVKVGDKVQQGQVLCIVEAMKLMNEIECDTDGTILEIYPKNAQPVEFGEPLYAIDPA